MSLWVSGSRVYVENATSSCLQWAEQSTPDMSVASSFLNSPAPVFCVINSFSNMFIGMICHSMDRLF